MSTLNEHAIHRMKEEAAAEVSQISSELESNYPGITEGIAAALGSGLGAGGSLTALTTLGVSGLSAAGITSGLAAAGAIVGGGMVAGIGVLAAPVALLGVAGYAVAKKRKNAKLAVALGTALAKLYSVQQRLLANAEYFKEELAGVKVFIEMLEKKKPA